MKKLSVFAAVAALSIIGCQDLSTEVESDSGNGVELAAKADDAGGSSYAGKKYGSMGDGTVAIPFKARFETSLVSNVPNAACGTGARPHYLNTQAGEGQATGLGQMTWNGAFCQDITDLLDGVHPGDMVPWQSLGHMIFTAANGDELWTTGGGDIVPTDKPGYLFEFLDPFVFVGGTGRFEGASGSGMTESYVPETAGAPVEHYWSGTLVLRKGND